MTAHKSWFHPSDDQPVGFVRIMNIAMFVIAPLLGIAIFVGAYLLTIAVLSLE